MALSDTDRQELLKGLGLSPDGESLSLSPPPDAPAKEVPEAAKQTDVKIPDVEALTDEQLLSPGAFDRYKLKAGEVGRTVSSPHNKRLYARIQDLHNRIRDAENEARKEAKQERKKEDRNHVREKVKADTANRAASAVLEAMEAAGIDLDDLAELLNERKR